MEQHLVFGLVFLLEATGLALHLGLHLDDRSLQVFYAASAVSPQIFNLLVPFSDSGRPFTKNLKIILRQFPYLWSSFQDNTLIRRRTLTTAYVKVYCRIKSRNFVVPNLIHRGQ